MKCRPSFKTLLLALAFTMIASVANAQSPPTDHSARDRARAQRRREIARHNYAQNEAIRLVFGPSGLPALTRYVGTPAIRPSRRVHFNHY